MWSWPNSFSYSMHARLVGWLCCYGPSTHFMSFWVWSVILDTLFKADYQYLVPIRSPVTDNYPSWISGRVSSWPNLNERMWLDRGSNQRPLDSQSDTLPTVLGGPSHARQPRSSLQYFFFTFLIIIFQIVVYSSKILSRTIYNFGLFWSHFWSRKSFFVHGKSKD